MSAEGVTQEDFAPDKDPHNWSEKQREQKLTAVKAKFPMAEDKVRANENYFELLQ